MPDWIVIHCVPDLLSDYFHILCISSSLLRGVRGDRATAPPGTGNDPNGNSCSFPLPTISSRL
ncbi:MAG TPA: hypothetical protein V6D20_18660, partial [Candidatus Obscuribacterales bacterium]